MTTENSVAPGRYNARAIEWGLGKTSTGKERVAVQLELTDPSVLGRRLTWYGYFTEGSLPHTVKALRALGWQGADLSVLDGLDRNDVSIVVEHEDYEGKTQVRVKWINEPGSLGVKTPLQGDEAKSFAARMKANILALEQGQAKPNNAKPSPARPTKQTDDIPF